MAPTGPSVGMVDVPSMVLDGLPSCGARGLGGADSRWSYPVGRVQCGKTPSSDYATPPACGGHMPTGADGAGNPLGLVAGPPRNPLGNPLGVAVTMGTGCCPLVPAHTWQGWEVTSRAGTTCPLSTLQGRTWGLHRALGSRQSSTRSSGVPR